MVIPMPKFLIPFFHIQLKNDVSKCFTGSGRLRVDSLLRSNCNNAGDQLWSYDPVLKAIMMREKYGSTSLCLVFVVKVGSTRLLIEPCNFGKYGKESQKWI